MRSSLFLRTFLFCGLGYGVLQAVMGLVQGEPASRAIGFGAFVGILFGLAMATILGIAHSVGLKRRGFDPDREGGLAVDVRESLEVPLPPEQALEHCRAALERMRVKGVQVDPALATVSGRGRMTWASFGEQVECRVQPADRGSRVEIRSRPTVRTTIVDYGKNRQNVANIRAHLAQAG